MQKEILVVDDEQPIRDLLSEGFKGAGYEPHTAESAEAALEFLKDHKVQVMFLDLKLPGMNGLELARRIRRDNPIAFLYAVTGYVSLFELADCREAGFDDYFTKPVKLSALFKAAEQAFEKLSRWRNQGRP